MQLLDEASVQRCIDDIRALQRPPALIILDTYGKSIVDAMRSDRGDGDRNETNRALRNADRIRQAAGRHATIVLVTHSTKDGRTQAHSAAFKQGLYMVARLIGTATDGSTGTFRCEKLKTKHFADILLQFREVETPSGSTTLVIAHGQERVKKQRVSQEEVLATLTARPMTPAEIGEILGSDRKGVQKHLGRLVAAGKAMRVGGGYGVAAA